MPLERCDLAGNRFGSIKRYCFNWRAIFFIVYILLGSHSLLALLFQELARPTERLVRPEQLKLFFRQITPVSLQVVLHKFLQLRFLLCCQICQPFEVQSAGVSRHWLITFRIEFLGLLSTRHVNYDAHLCHDMGTTQHARGTAWPFFNNLQVRFPRVAANKMQYAQCLFGQPARYLT